MSMSQFPLFASYFGDTTLAGIKLCKLHFRGDMLYEEPFYLAQCYVLDPSVFVWVDETGTDRRDNVRKFSYALRGMRRPVTHRILSRGERIISALSTTGIIANNMTKSSVSGDTFFDFFSYVKGYLMKHDSLLQCIPDPTDIIKDAFDSVTVAHCNAFIKHAGYT